LAPLLPVCLGLGFALGLSGLILPVLQRCTVILRGWAEACDACARGQNCNAPKWHALVTGMLLFYSQTPKQQHTAIQKHCTAHALVSPGCGAGLVWGGVVMIRTQVSLKHSGWAVCQRG
jgi:hypothetical protein